MSEKLKAAIAAREEAEANVKRVLREEYPVGSTLRWGYHRDAGNTFEARVEKHGYGDRVVVRSLKSHRMRRIVASYIQG